MRFSTKITLFIRFILIICFLTSTIKINTSANQVPNYDYRKIANIAVTFANLDNPYQKQFSEHFQSIENENKDKVKFTFINSKGNIKEEFVNLDLITHSNFDLIIAYLVDTSESAVKDLILKAKDKNIPLILININPKVIENVLKYYNKVAFVSFSLSESGNVQGQMIASIWNSHKNNMDKNKDGILQCILLKGPYLNQIAEERSTACILTINKSGIQTEELQLIYSDWSREVAKNTISNMLLRYNNKIEAIISNNDNMAIGAIEGLQKYGYNTDNNLKYIPIFGIDGIIEAIELVDKGFMAGTVIVNSKEIAEGLYIIGMNMINNFNPLENTNFKFENNQIYIPTNPKPYENNNIFLKRSCALNN